MGRLNIEPNINLPDNLYQQLIDMHAGLSDADSMKLNARLILLLVNHISDPDVIDQAIAIAQSTQSEEQK